jgi:ArsR family transcriptional regulator, lead/cadmium/zinc/bismuth-responsive transcriptional repressor
MNAPNVTALAAAASAQVEELAGLFKLLADPTRLRILAALVEHGSLCVHELVAELGLRQPAVSQQLRMLRAARVVRGRREGREIHYALDDDHILALLEGGLEHVRHGAGGGRGDAL